MTTETQAPGSQKERSSQSSGFWALFALLHVPLALYLQQDPRLAAAAMAAAGVAGVVLAFDTRRPQRVVILAGYMVGAEVLWRMTLGNGGLQAVKYMLAGIFFLAAICRRPARPLNAAPLYFLLLLPSAVLTLFNNPPAEALAQLDFNLSGPLALAAALWFFADQTIPRSAAQQVSLAFLAPITGILTLTGAALLQTPSIIFYNTQSNAQVTAGYAPNEISITLGLGALICFLYLLLLRPAGWMRVFLGGLLALLLAQTALTFSRGGIYLFAAGAFVAVLASLRDAQTRKTALIILALLGLAVVVLTPALAWYTHNAIFERFGDFGVSGRTEAYKTELALWIANPILGVGPGMGDLARGAATQALGGRLRSHNELTRMLGEHGLPGLAGLLIFLALCWQGLRRPGSGGGKAWTLALLAWAVGCLVYTAFRTAAPALMLGLAIAAARFDGKPAENRVQPAARQPVVRHFRFKHQQP